MHSLGKQWSKCKLGDRDNQTEVAAFQMTLLLPDIPTHRSRCTATVLPSDSCLSTQSENKTPQTSHVPTSMGAQQSELESHIKTFTSNRKNDHCSFTDSQLPATETIQACVIWTQPPPASSQHWPHQHKPCWEGQPRSRAPTATPKHPNAGRCINPEQVVMVSESPGSAPSPSCKHDSNTSQPKPLSCVSKRAAPAPRLHPWGCCTVTAPCSVTAKPTRVSTVTGLHMQLPSHFHKQFSTEINIRTGMTFQHKEVFPKKLSKSLQVMHLPSQRHALDQLPQ